MKTEDYFKIMDCASEEDITEMMQHRRFRQIPSGEEDTMKQSDQQEKSVFRMTRRGVATGSAVAAALLALNVGLGGFMLHKSADDSVSTAESEVIEMTEAAAETTTAETEAEETATTAAEIRSAGKQNEVKSTAKKTADTKTAAAPKQAANTQEAAAETPAQQTPAQQTPAAPAKAETPKSTKLTYSLIPSDRAYETTGTNEKAPVVCHVKPGEQFKMKLIVQNDPGVASFNASYRMEKMDLLSGTGSQYYNGEVNSHLLAEGYACDDRVLNIGGTGNGSTKAPDGAALGECTLIAPSQPGRYVIQEYITKTYSVDVDEEGNEHIIPVYHVYADADYTEHIDCDIIGAEIIVDEGEATSGYLVDPETLEGPVIYFEPVTAHAGQKNVPVNVCIKGADPFVSGHIALGYDPALKSKLFDHDTMDGIEGLSESSRLGISAEGTLLKDAMLLNTSTMFGSLIQVFFNNYRDFGYDEQGLPTVFHHGETQSDAVISEDGVLFTMYFDMPEECGTYRIFAYDSSIGGGAEEEPGFLPYQTIQNFIPCDIKVIP